MTSRNTSVPPIPPSLATLGSRSLADPPKSGNVLLDAALLAGGWAMKAAVEWVKTKAVDAYTVQLTVDESDMAFDWVEGWLRTLPEFKKGRRLKVETSWSRKHTRRRAMSVEALEVGYAPATGTHVFRFKGVVVILERKEESSGGLFGRMKTSLIFRFVSSDPQIAKDMIGEAVEFGLSRDESMIPLYQNSGGDWGFVTFKRRRPPESVFLAPGQWDEITGVIQYFLDNEDWFIRASIPYKKGILLQGPPGTGKSTAAVAIASQFEAPIYYLNLLSEGLNDDNIASLFSRIPYGSFVLIEDGDALFDVNRSVQTDELGKKQTAVSMSGYLNSLDGLLASEGYVVIITTNHPERFEEALKRKSRIDHTFTLAYALRSQIIGYLVRLADAKVPIADIEAFAERIGDGIVPMVNIQAALLDAKGDVAVAIRDFHIPTPEEEEEIQRLVRGAAPPPKKEEEKAKDTPPGETGSPKSSAPSLNGGAR